jgi:hypothetical protein
MTDTANPTGKCGTNAGYEAHRHAGTPTCGPCRAAHSAYTTAWRLRPEVGAHDHRRQKARRRALARLGREYPQRFSELLADELRGASE